MKGLFALVVFAMTLAVAQSASVTWGGAARLDSLKRSTAAGNPVIWFTPTTEVPAAGKVTITASVAMFTNAQTPTVLCTSDGADLATTCTSSSTATVLTVTLASNTKLVAGKIASITVSSQLVANNPAAAMTFSIETSADTTPLSTQTGWADVNALTVQSATAARSGNYKAATAPGDLTVTFLPTTKTAANAAIVITTTGKKIWTADNTAATCTVHQFVPKTGLMTTVAVTSSTASGTGTIMTIATGALLNAGLPVKVVCTGNTDVNLAATSLIKIRLETAADTVKTADTAGGCPLTLSHANVIGTAVTWTSATRTNLVVGTAAATAGDLVVTFTPATALVQNNVITLTASEEIFTTAGASTGITATGNNPSAALAITADAATKVVETAASVPLATAKMKNHLEMKVGASASVHPIVLTIPKALLAANGATPGAVTFSISTTTDKGTLFAQTGYTYTCPSSQSLVGGACITPSSSSSAANGTAGGGASGTATGTETTVTQVYTFASLTVAAYTGKMKSNCECAYANTVGGATTPLWCTATSSAYTYISGVAMSSSAAHRRSAKVTFVLKVKSSVKTTAQLQTLVASGSTATAFATALAAVNTASNYTAAPGTATVAVATFTGGSSSSASTLLPSMLSLVAAIFVAARQ